MSVTDSVNIGDGIDLYFTTTRLFDTMPTLQYVFLTTCGHTQAMPSRKRRSAPEPQELGKWLSSKAWRAVRDSEDVWNLRDAPTSDFCIELSEEASERVLDKAELQLSRHEEVCGVSDLDLPRLSRLTWCRTKYVNAAVRRRGGLRRSAASEPLDLLCL